MSLDFLDPASFAERLGVPEHLVVRWAREGQLPSIRLGRLRLIPSDALERILSRSWATPEGR